MPETCPSQVTELAVNSALSGTGFLLPSEYQPCLGARLDKIPPHPRPGKIREHLVTARPNHEVQTVGRQAPA